MCYRDFYIITYSVLKTHLCKLPPKVVTYRGFKKFENERFMDSLKLTRNSQDVDWTKNRQLFFELCRNELEYHAPRKKSTSVGIINLSWLKRCLNPLWNKCVLRNNFLKHPIVANKLAYTKQSNFCVSLLRKVKREYFANLIEKNVTDNRKFGKLSSLFSLRKINQGKE